MKLVLAIVNSDDSADVMRALTKEGIQVTKLATTGGFLMAGNTTFMTQRGISLRRLIVGRKPFPPAAVARPA